MNRLLAVTIALFMTASATAVTQDGPRGWRDDGGERTSRQGREDRRDVKQERSAEPRVQNRTDVQVNTGSSARSQPDSGRRQGERYEGSRDQGSRDSGRTYVHGVPGNDNRVAQQNNSRDYGRGDSQRGRDNRYDNRGNNQRNDNRYDNRNNSRYDNNRGNDRGRDWDRRHDRGRDWDRGRSHGHRDWNRSGWDRGYWRNSWNHGWSGTRYRAPARYHYPRGYSRLSWNIGFFLPAAYYASNYYVDYRPYGLAPPPYGCSWVRISDDLLLVDLETGEVLDAIYGFYY